MRIRSFKRHLKVKRFKSKCESLSRFLQTILNLFLAFCYELEFSSLFIVFSPSSQTPCIIPTTCSPLFSFFRNLLSMVKFFSEDYLIILSFNTTLMWYIWALGNTKPWVGGKQVLLIFWNLENLLKENIHIDEAWASWWNYKARPNIKSSLALNSGLG